MSFLLKKLDEWAQDEDEEMMKSIKKNYGGPLPQLSMLFPSWKRSMRPISISLFTVHNVMLSTHLVLMLFSVKQSVSEWDLELASLTVHFSLLIIIGLSYLYLLPYQRKTYAKHFKIMVKDIGKYRSGSIYREDWCVKEEKKIKKGTLYYLVIPALIGISIFSILIGPYINNWVLGMENPYTLTMVNKALPFPCWYPFPTHKGVLHWVAVIGQLTAASCLASIIMQVLLFFLINTQRIRFELRVIGYSLETLFSRSTKLFLRMYPDKNRTDVRVRDPEYQRVVELCLIDSVVHHHAVGELLSLYAMEVDIPVGFAFSIGTGVIALSLFNILEALKNNDYLRLMLFSVMILNETMVMFVLSSLGEALTDESVKLRNQLYYLNWYNLDLRNRKIFLNFQTTMTEPIIINAMGLIKLSLDTFSSIMNTAYSFFNLMNAQTEE